MAYPFSESHDMIGAAAQSWLADWYDEGQALLRIAEEGVTYDAVAWQDFSVDLGFAGIAIEATYGGTYEADGTAYDLGRIKVMEALGAHLCAIPFLSSCAYGGDLVSLLAPTVVKQVLLPDIAAGSLKLGYADGRTHLREQAGKLSGQLPYVAYGAVSDLMLITWKCGDVCQLAALRPETEGVTCQTCKTMDPTRSFATFDFTDVNLADMQMVAHISEADLNQALAGGHRALAAECLGGAQACLDMTLAYTATRVQFDRPIASFQAVKHRCADMFTSLEAARSAVYWSALAPAHMRYQAALMAKAYSSDMFFNVAGEAIQLHGGIGFTWEYPLHFFFKRARANRHMFGSSEVDYSQIASQILEHDL